MIAFCQSVFSRPY